MAAEYPLGGIAADTSAASLDGNSGTKCKLFCSTMRIGVSGLFCIGQNCIAKTTP